MNILLTTSAAPLITPLTFNEKTFPMGMGFLISVLREAGHKVFFIDNYLQPSPFLEERFLQRNKIDYVGIYSCSSTFDDTLRMFKKIQYFREKKEWQGKIMVGGPHPSLCPESIPDYVDHIVIGEGERAILDIVEGKASERIIRYDRLKNLDVLPFPAYDVFAKMPYIRQFAMMPLDPIFNMSTSRGCPYQCTFCSVNFVWGGGYRFFSAERVVEDIERLVRDFGARGIYFREDNFMLRKDRITRICELLISKGVPVKWGCEARVDSLQDNEIVKLISKAGCVNVFLGIESFCQRVLDVMKKNVTVEQNLRALELCRKHGITAFGSFVIGIPGETEGERRTTLDTIKKYFSPRYYSVCPYVGIPNSELYHYCLENGYVSYRQPNGLFYIKDHDQLLRLALNYPVPLSRRDPTKFIDSKSNIHNMAQNNIMSSLNIEKLGTYLQGKSVLEIGLNEPLMEDSPCSSYTHMLLGNNRDIYDVFRELDGIGAGGFDVVFLFNVIELIPYNDLRTFLEVIKGKISREGCIIGLTVNCFDEQYRNALAMLHFPVSFIYSKEDIKRCSESVLGGIDVFDTDFPDIPLILFILREFEEKPKYLENYVTEMLDKGRLWADGYSYEKFEEIIESLTVN